MLCNASAADHYAGPMLPVQGSTAVQTLSSNDVQQCRDTMVQMNSSAGIQHY
jgi:hypothetical protein